MEDFVTFNLAKKLKEKGFREKCFATYTSYSETLKLNEINTDKRPANYKLNIEEFRECYNYYDSAIDAPTISQVLKWFRKEKELHIEFISNASGYCYIISRTPQRGGSDLYSCFDSGTNDAGEWDDYEEAALHAIEYILDNLII